MDIGSLLLGLALLAVIVFIVARPLIERSGPGDEPASSAEQLLGSRERVLVQLRDLDFDNATGKINPEDYAAQRAQLMAEGVAILKQLDALGVNADETVAEPAVAAADEIEIAVAQQRARRAAPGLVAATVAAAPMDEIEIAVAQRRARRAAPKPAAASPRRTAAPAASKTLPRDLDAEIEASVAQRRSQAPAAPVAALARVVDKRVAAEKPATLEILAAAAAEEMVGRHTLNCAQCGTGVLPDDRFCPKCGSPQMITCGNCGRVARAGDEFCAYCGQPLPASVAGPAQA